MIGRSVGALSIVATILGLAGSTQRLGPPKERLIASIQGPALYKAYCAVCHGPEAKGDGPVAATLKVPPPDSASAADPKRLRCCIGARGGAFVGPEPELQ